MDAWTAPNYDAACLLTIDVQNDFVRPASPFAIPGTLQQIPNIVAALNAWRGQGKPIVHVIRLYAPGGSNADLCRRGLLADGTLLVAPGSIGARLYPDIAPHGDQDLDWPALLSGEITPIATNEFVCYKPRWSAFFRTRLDGFLRNRDMDTIVACGANFPNCPRATIYDASARDFRIVLLEDATSRCNQQGLNDLHAIGVHSMSTEDWLRGPGSGKVDILID
ncbi:MAG: cysteine hydrolase family protein [Planctomycetota bacterium]